jgi:hypothetical protein
MSQLRRAIMARVLCEEVLALIHDCEPAHDSSPPSPGKSRRVARSYKAERGPPPPPRPGRVHIDTPHTPTGHTAPAHGGGCSVGA